RLASLGPRLRHPEQPLSAPALKAVAGAMDGVVTGRMHLAIAALGQGRPVAGLTYQDKFQGLFRHFELPTDLLMPPSQVVEPDRLTDLLRRFHADLAELEATVRRRLPQVQELALANLRDLLPPAGP
ncbi:MAG TPA: polysaccharide pyruvyl transferase family protein, partial [Solimonas sp.]|nr:polysaccharide pyruvyl transferase family protein [Solimonas sp.]